jgi:hypothetical protein
MVRRGGKQYTQRLSSVASAGRRPGMGHVAPVDPVNAETQWTEFLFTNETLKIHLKVGTIHPLEFTCSHIYFTFTFFTSLSSSEVDP